MAVNKPVGDNARKGAVKKRSQVKTKLGGAGAWTKRSTSSGKFMAVRKRIATKTSAKKFKGVRAEKKASKR
jgi:hypothetical protein